MQTYPSYYKSLKQVDLKYPHPAPHDFEKDLHRTGKDVSPDTIDKMRNILGAFVKRSPSIGYCQGMNYLTARLLTVLEEEEAFWVLIQTIEEILPQDYYCNLIGVLVD